MLDFVVNGLDQVATRFGKIPGQLQDRLRPFMSKALAELYGLVRANIAGNFHSSGPLYQSVQQELTETSGAIVGRVFIDPDQIPYAYIQECGGVTAAHDIVPVRAQALAFIFGARGGAGGPLVFAKRVHHPGSRIPAKPYMAPALQTEAAGFEDGIRQLTHEVTQ
jgi:phage gpG-like protein